MFRSLVLLSLFFVICQTYTLRSSDDELRPISLSKHGHGTQTMTLRYEAPRPATVLWISRNMHASTNESFVNGQGVSEITSDQPMNGVTFVMPGSSLFYYLGTYLMDEEVLIPRVEIQYNGEEIVYTPGEPTELSVRWTKPAADPSDSMTWTFIGLDPSVSDEMPIMVSARHPGGQRFLSHVETTTIGNMHETSADLLLQDQSGLVLLTFMYESPGLSMSVLKVLPIRPEGGPVFPDNFLGFLPIIGSEIYCFQSSYCQIPCLALGPEIESLELLDDEGNSVSSEVTYHSEWMYASYFTVPTLSIKVNKTYSCVATNSNGLAKENGVQVRFNPF